MSKSVNNLHIEVHTNIRDNGGSRPKQSNQRAVSIEWFRHVKNWEECKAQRRKALYRYILDNFDRQTAKEYLELRSKHPNYKSGSNAVARSLDVAVEVFGLSFLEPHLHKAQKRKRAAETAKQNQANESIAQILRILERMKGKLEWKFGHQEGSSKGSMLIVWSRDNRKRPLK